MAMLDFNANEVAPLAPLEAIPAGKYEVVVTDSDMKPNKAGTGSYLELWVEIVSGEHAGRRLVTRLNLSNPSRRAVEMARAELSAICHAAGVLTPRDSQELHNIPVLATVRLVDRADGTGKANEIGGWEARKSPVPAQAAPVTATGASPWQR